MEVFLDQIQIKRVYNVLKLVDIQVSLKTFKKTL